jgi:hypothetical protein
VLSLLFRLYYWAWAEQRSCKGDPVGDEVAARHSKKKKKKLHKNYTKITKEEKGYNWPNGSKSEI